MQTLKDLRSVLKSLAHQVEVLPAVGGAVEDLVRPDYEEREDQALNPTERIHELVYESRPAPLYRPLTPLHRTHKHLYRYFLDGSFRSYFLGTLLEHDRETPVHFAQVGACVLHRRDDGTVCRHSLTMENLLMVGKDRLSDGVWNQLEQWTQQSGIRLVDLTQHGITQRITPETDLRMKAEGRVVAEMHRLEAFTATQVLSQLSQDRWLVIDGSLQFDPLMPQLKEQYSNAVPPVIGVAKSFRKDPQFVFGRGPRAQRFSIFQLLKDLQAEHRTAVFSAQGGEVVFWYVRLREQKHLDYPLMGVVKVELANPSREAVDSELIDMLSGALVAERSVSPHGSDRRWHAHLYPIHLAERAIKELLLSREAVQQFVKWY